MKQELYQCPACKLYYRDREIRDRCEAWCREHQSCNLDLVQYAVPAEELNKENKDGSNA